MQIESHATPPVETPEQRYATLHRAIERGLASDEVWKELTEVCVRLGHSDEAVSCVQHIANSTARGLVQSKLQRLGLIAAPPDKGHLTAPAASDAGTPEGNGEENAAEPRLIDYLTDAGQYVFHQHMPWLVLVTTLAFPLVIGLGGFLTIGGSPWVLAAIAALPGLCVLAIVGAMGRQILFASSEGNGDVPPIPPFGELLTDARRFLVDALLVLTTLVVPPFVALALGTPLSTALPGIAISSFFAPLAWVLRQVRGDLQALSPKILLRVMARCGNSYAGLAVATLLLFAPATLVTFLVSSRPLWVQIAVIGPLCVLPIFVASRLFGTWLDCNRTQLASLLRRAPSQPPRVATPVVDAPKVPETRFPRRPASIQHFRAPVLRSPMDPAPQPASATPVRRRMATAPSQPPAAVRRVAAPAAARTVVTRKAATAPVAKAPVAKAPVAPAPMRQPAPQAATRPASRPAPRAIEGRGPARFATEVPDLLSMPGAVVLSGSERERHGAAAKKP